MGTIQIQKTSFLSLFGCLTFILVFFLILSPAFAKDWVYTVQSGDNLWNLSKKHLKSMRYWRDFVELNKIADPYNIPPGTTLRFPMEWLKSGSSIATVIELSGSAAITERHTGRVYNAVKGNILWDGDVIRTDEGSNATLQFADGSRILLQAESEMTMEKLLSYGATGMADTQVRLESGRTHNEVVPNKGPGSRFEITTPSAIAAVRGTEYRISADDNRESRAEVLTGVVGVDSVGVSKEVPGGYGTISYPDKKPLEPVALLPEPNLAGFPKIVTRVPFPLKPGAVQDAHHYRLQISDDEEFRTLLFDSIFPTVNMWGPDIPDGMYYLRVHGIDDKGLEGLYSTHAFEIRAHPVPPLLVGPQDQAIIHESTPGFQWSEPQQADRYRFQLAADKNFTKTLIDEEGLNGTTFKPDKILAPGVYFWRVATIDSTGKTGPFSDHQQLRRTPPQPDMSDAQLNKEELVFSWRSAEADQGFRCQVAKSPEFSEPLIDQQVKDPQFSLKSFDPGEYYIRIAIVDSDGYAGPFAPYQMVKVPSPPPHPLAFIIPGAIILLFML